MPVTPTYPGVYVEEIPSGVRTIVGVATSITAFIGRAVRGPVDEPFTISSFGDFQRQFGGLAVDYPMSYAVRDFYLTARGGGIACGHASTGLGVDCGAKPPCGAAPAGGVTIIRLSWLDLSS